jgi:hypothetical protein
MRSRCVVGAYSLQPPTERTFVRSIRPPHTSQPAMLLRLARACALLLPSLLSGQRPAPVTGAARAVALDSAFIKVPTWRFVGPDGNRVIAVAGVPGEYRTYYAGAASGGLFKSTNGGIRWVPITDSLRVSSISAIAVAPSDASVVWFGTGETFLRSNVSIGDGIYRSTDAGQHWDRMGLESTGRIGRVLIHPTNPDIVYAAAQGHGYAPQADRGLWRTTDGGRQWKKVLFVNDSTGIIDVTMDPSNPRVLFAAASGCRATAVTPG